MKQLLYVMSLILILSLCPLHVDAVTSIRESTQGSEVGGSYTHVKPSNTVCLLSWQDNKLYTTKGTFVTDGVQVDNKSGIEKDKIMLQKKPPILDMIKNGNVITKIIILPE